MSAVVVVVGLLVPTLLYPAEFTALTGLTTTEILLVFGLTVVLSFVVITVVAIRWKQWRSFAIAAVVGQAAGAGSTFRNSVGSQSTFPFLLQITSCCYLYSSIICLDFRHRSPLHSSCWTANNQSML